jgi:ethanolamine utilization protein EutQ (cupin superfamily)
MVSFHPDMQKARFADIESDVHGRISKKTAELDGVSVTQVTFGTGARWSDDLKEYAGTDLCELPHVAVVVSGALGVRMGDGSDEVFEAGDVMLLPPGHDAWTVGEQACTFVEFSRGGDYYAS